MEADRPGIVARLSVRRGGAVVLTTAINRPLYSIGRRPSNDLVLPEAEVALRHAEIRIGPAGAVITDLGSESGTVVDGTPIAPSQPRALREFASIRIGPYEIGYRFVTATAHLAAPAVPLDAVAAVASVATPVDDVPVPPSCEARQPSPEIYPGRYLKYLPVIFHDQDFMARLLGIFEAIWEPLEQRQDHLSMYFDPRTCPPSWLPWFASWLGLELRTHWPEHHVRALLVDAVDLYRWRGTAVGLARVLDVCTGVTSTVRESDTEPFVFHVTVELPAQSRPDLLDTVESLILAHKPAHCGYVLEVKR